MSKYEERRKRLNRKRKKEKLKTLMVWGFSGIAILSMVGYLIWVGVRPSEGEEVHLEEADHVAEGEPIEAQSDPPTSGTHYGVSMPAGFYNEFDPEVSLPYPDGYLIHSLEHGYTVFWYNCEIISVAECVNLKSQIQEVMSDFNNVKVIGFPRASILFPVVLTSWGQILEMETFDADAAERFVKVNGPKAPEPNAP